MFAVWNESRRSPNNGKNVQLSPFNYCVFVGGSGIVWSRAQKSFIGLNASRMHNNQSDIVNETVFGILALQGY